MLKLRKSMSLMLTISILIACIIVIPSDEVFSSGGTCKSMLGVNLEGLCDWMNGSMFVDLMKTSRHFGSVNAPWDENAQTDDAGWPIGDAGVWLIANATKEDGSYINITGTYKLSFEGRATIVPSGATLANQHYANGITTADIIVRSGATSLSIAFTNTSNPNTSTGKGVRNVKIIRPGYLPDSKGNYPTFTRGFLKAIEPFSTIRFMDYLDTNGQQNGQFDKNGTTYWFSNKVKNWSDRKRITDSTQAGKVRGYYGGAFEYIVELANITNKDIWINIPSNASDDYILGVANLLKKTLKPNINVYVEYSNEVWNWMFAAAQANLYYANNDARLTGYGQSAYMVRYAERSAHISQLFKSVFGENAINNRIRSVLAWQQNAGEAFDFMLNSLKSTYPELGNPSKLFYSFSIAPYFLEPLPQDCTSTDVIHKAMIKSSDSKTESKLKLVATANKWNMKGGVMAYEGGPHHQGQVETNLATRIAAHRNANMQSIITRDIKNNWFDLGCKNFMYFSLSGGSSKYGSWGALESFEDSSFNNSAKYKALVALSNIPLTDVHVYKNPFGMINNGGFENDLAGWNSPNSNTSTVFSINKTQFYSGAKSLKLTGQASSVGLTQSDLALQPNKNYTLSFYTKGNNAWLSVCNDRTGWDKGYSLETGNNNSWTKKTINFNTSTDTGFFLLLQDRLNGTTYFDNFTIVNGKE